MISMSNWFHHDNASPGEVKDANVNFLQDPGVQNAIQAYQQFLRGSYATRPTEMPGQRQGMGGAVDRGTQQYQLMQNLQHALQRAGMPSTLTVGTDANGRVTVRNSGGVQWDHVGEAVVIAMATWGIGSAIAAGSGTAAGGATAAGVGTDAAVDGVITSGGATAAAVAPAAVAPAAAGGSAAAAGLTWQNLLKYGTAAGSDAVDAYLKNQQADAARADSLAATRQKVALEETTLDPFRGAMHQVNDAQHLEHTAAGPQTYRPAGNTRYSRYYNPGNEPPPISDELRSGALNARAAVLSGRGAMPTMTNQKNWGQNGTLDLTNPATPLVAPPGAPPAPGVKPAATAAPTWPGDPTAAADPMDPAQAKQMIAAARRRYAPRGA